MSVLKVEQEVSKEAYELAVAVVGLVKSIKDHASDGLTATDVAQAVTENIQKLMEGVSGVEKISAEYVENPAALLRVGGFIGAELVAVLLGKAK